MAASQGYPTPRRAWAKAHLRRGQSGGQIWEISADYPEARLTLGADPSAGWQIEANGVRPIHCELFWDGEALWVADIHLVGGVFLDGIRITDWVQIQGPAELRFGMASLDIETSAPVSQQMASNPSIARPVTVTDMVLPPDQRPSSPVFGGAASDESLPDLEGGATRVVMPELVGEATQIAAPLPTAPAVAVGGAHSNHGSESHGGRGLRPLQEGHALDAMRPRLGGAAIPTPASPTATPGGEATRMVAMPDRQPPPPPTPDFAPSSASPIAPMAAPLAPAQPVVPAVEGGFVVPPADAAPPATEKKESFLKKLLPKDEPRDPNSKQALPTRTWILLAVTVLVTVGWLLWDDTPEPDPAEVAAAQQQQAAAAQAAAEAEAAEAEAAEARARAEAEAEAARAAEAAQAAVPEAAEQAEVAPAPPAPRRPAARRPARRNEPPEPTAQRRAADAYRAGRYDEALALYRQLAAENPDDAAYGVMARIMARVVRERCVAAGGGETCDR